MYRRAFFVWGQRDLCDETGIVMRGASASRRAELVSEAIPNERSAGFVAIKDYHPKWIARGVNRGDSVAGSFGAL
jgi:hypothetical protein